MAQRARRGGSVEYTYIVSIEGTTLDASEMGAVMDKVKGYLADMIVDRSKGRDDPEIAVSDPDGNVVSSA